MKKTVLALFFLFAAAPAFGQANYYLGLKGGWEWSRETSNASWQTIGGQPTYIDGGTVFSGRGPTIGAYAGHYFSQKLRAELAYHFKHLEDEENNGDFLNGGYDSYNIMQHTVLINAFYYPFKKTALNPFVGAGAGIGLNKIEKDGVYTGFAYSFYLGADYDFYDDWTIDLTAAYTSVLNPYGRNYNNIYNFGITAGIRYNF